MSLLKLFFKTNTQQSENETAIKDFFFYHHGDGMSMDRDDPQKYKQYRSLKEDTVEQWRQELIAQDFELLINDNVDNQWILVGNLIRLISSSTAQTLTGLTSLKLLNSNLYGAKE